MPFFEWDQQSFITDLCKFRVFVIVVGTNAKECINRFKGKVTQMHFGVCQLSHDY